MNVPLGFAIKDLIVETGIPSIGHHHDFGWERERFQSNAAADYLDSAFPPNVGHITHVVIKSHAAQQLAFRKGVSPILIPNVMDFENPPAAPDRITTSFRDELGFKSGETIILQPTRIVPRKRIEAAIEFTKRLAMNCVLVVTHDVGDEGTEYQEYLEQYGMLMDLRILFSTERVNHTRRQTESGQQIFSLEDAYNNANMITYPSIIEGFGNAFLETLYFKRPMLVHVYDVFRADIRLKGFQVLSYTDFITEKIVQEARRCLTNPEQWQANAELNYEIARKHYSCAVLEENLTRILNDFDIS